MNEQLRSVSRNSENQNHLKFLEMSLVELKT